jgi:hypothetical protein
MLQISVLKHRATAQALLAASGAREDELVSNFKEARHHIERLEPEMSLRPVNKQPSVPAKPIGN